MLLAGCRSRSRSRSLGCFGRLLRRFLRDVRLVRSCCRGLRVRRRVVAPSGPRLGRLRRRRRRSACFRSTNVSDRQHRHDQSQHPCLPQLHHRSSCAVVPTYPNFRCPVVSGLRSHAGMSCRANIGLLGCRRVTTVGRAVETTMVEKIREGPGARQGGGRSSCRVRALAASECLLSPETTGALARASRTAVPLSTLSLMGGAWRGSVRPTRGRSGSPIPRTRAHGPSALSRRRSSAALIAMLRTTAARGGCARPTRPPARPPIRRRRTARPSPSRWPPQTATIAPGWFRVHG